MYSREVEGEVLEFGVSGKLVMNVLVMYDRQTESLWSQLLGRAIRGPMEGTELTFLPAWQTTWQDWKERHPQTLALVKGYSGRYDPYDSYYASGASGVAFSRTVDGQALTFEAESSAQLKDAETGSIWDGFSGEAIQGEMLGSHLERVKSTSSFWFGWKDFHPDTMVYAPDR